ncbi:tetratricopeptide repeat protein [Candidatus Sumerlaeota bacterium]|nr:tetratricopeptide repeat protein [Candidatus Sumerlaeota bacterium]
MAKVHITRKELKHDEVKDAGRSILEYLDVHRTSLLTGALIVLAIIVAFRVGSSMVGRHHAETARDLALARSYYVQSSRQSDPASSENRLDMALQIANRLVDEYGTSKTGLEALYVKGSCLYLRQDYDGAAAAFQSCIDGAEDASMKAQGYLALGYCFDSKAFLDSSDAELGAKAREAFEKARDLGAEPGGGLSYVAADAMMNLAEMDVEAGKIDEAMKAYRTIADARSMTKDANRFRSDDDTQERKKGGDERLRMVQEGVRESLTQFSFQRTAEERLAQLEVRAQASAAPEATSE